MKKWLLGAVAVLLVTASLVYAQEVRNLAYPVRVLVGYLELALNVPLRFMGRNNTDIGRVRYTSVQLTNGQVLALNATPITVIAAPGAGFAVQVLGVSASFDYTAAYTVATGDDWRLFYSPGRESEAAASGTIETTGFLDATADIVQGTRGGVDGSDNPPNTAVVLHQTTLAAISGGNASNVVTVRVFYFIYETP